MDGAGYLNFIVKRKQSTPGIKIPLRKFAHCECLFLQSNLPRDKPSQCYPPMLMSCLCVILSQVQTIAGF